MPGQIVFIASRNPLEGRTGHPHYVRAHARAVIRTGFEPHIFCAERQSDVVQTDFGIVHQVESASLRLSPKNPGHGFRKSLMMWHAPLIAARVAAFLAAKNGPHIIHGFGTWSCAGVMASRNLRLQGNPTTAISSLYTTITHESLAWVQGLAAAHGWSQRLRYRVEHLWLKRIVVPYEQRAYRESHLVLVNYEAMRRQLLAEYGVGPEIRKVPYTSETAFVPAQACEVSEVPDAVAALQPPDAPLVVSVSRHDPRKGLHVLLDSLARLRAAGVPFRACLVSGGPLLEAHRHLATRLGLDGVATLVGWVLDPYPYLQHADVFVPPSLQEGSGSLALIEALQAGVAVVASNIDGIAEDVADGESAVLVPPGDAVALAAAIRRPLGDPVLRKRLADAARRTFETRFSAEVFAQALQRTYAELGFEGARG